MIAGIAQCGSPSQSIGAMPNCAERVVEQPVARVVQVAPHDRDGDERRHERREVDRAEERSCQRTSFAFSRSAAPSETAIVSGPPTSAK